MYLSMQRVRFSSPDAYDKFRTVFSDVRHHLMTKPGFIHLTWWEHPDEPGWYNEISMWASKEAVNDWHMDTYHKHAKEWAANGAIMEDIITNFELRATRLLRICPTCGLLQDKEYDLASRAEGPLRAVPDVWLQLPRGQGDGEQHVGVQGHHVILTGPKWQVRRTAGSGPDVVAGTERSAARPQRRIARAAGRQRADQTKTHPSPGLTG